MKRKSNLKYIFLTLILVLLVIFISGYSNYQIDAPCVDGDGDINLAGILCDKTVENIFGYDVKETKGIIIILVFLILEAAFIGGLFIEVIFNK